LAHHSDPDFDRKLRELGAVPLMHSIWAARTALTAKELKDVLRKTLDDNDRILGGGSLRRLLLCATVKDSGGAHNDAGTVFKLTLSGVPTTLYSFPASGQARSRARISSSSPSSLRGRFVEADVAEVGDVAAGVVPAPVAELPGEVYGVLARFRKF
jgi:uncharacterized repeat protein (TIGR03803 family)